MSFHYWSLWNIKCAKTKVALTLSMATLERFSLGFIVKIVLFVTEYYGCMFCSFIQSLFIGHWTRNPVTTSKIRFCYCLGCLGRRWVGVNHQSLHLIMITHQLYKLYYYYNGMKQKAKQQQTHNKQGHYKRSIWILFLLSYIHIYIFAPQRFLPPSQHTCSVRCCWQWQKRLPTLWRDVAFCCLPWETFLVWCRNMG